MIHHGDLFDVLPTLAAESIDACVTDPPYGIGFMGKEWDTFAPETVEKTAETGFMPHPIVSDNPNLNGRKRAPAISPSSIGYDRTPKGQREFQAWTERWAREVFRVLKPGAYLLVCGAPRSFHRMACGIEDAGFEVRDCLSWLFGQGFPKSLDISKAIDRELGKPREVAGRGETVDRTALDYGGATGKAKNGLKADWIETEPNTDAAQQWAGWGTALKPGWEPIFVARKPLTGTVARNVLEHGTGALNIGGCRLESAPPAEYREKLDRLKRQRAGEPSAERRYAEDGATDFAMKPGPRGGDELGRWPANVLLDEEAAAMLDEQTGDLGVSSGGRVANISTTSTIYGGGKGLGQALDSDAVRGDPGYGDMGGASRFYYVAKPSREERDFGCDGLQPRSGGAATDRKEGSKGLENPHAGAGRNGNNRNFHPTVKPVELMRWLVKLVTPPDGLVLDPFTGSGTTGMACRYEHRRFVGIEREAEYVEIAERRIAAVAPLFHDAEEST